MSPLDRCFGWRRFLARLSILTVLLSGCAQPGFAQALGAYVSAAEAPPSWGQFSKLVKYRIVSWIGANDPIANRLRAYLTKHAGQADGPPQSMQVRAWVNPDGTIERVLFSTLNNSQADADLQTILQRGNIGEGPPPEMLQPIRLRLSLNSKK
jgi:hypothetical protein